MSLTGHRRARWENWLLNSADEPIRRLDGVTGGSVDIGALTRLGTSGQLEIDERGQGIDWLNDRVQHIYNPGTGDEPWPVATLRFTSPSTKHHEYGVTYSVETLGKTSILDSATVGAGYALAAGTPVVATVVALIQATGETRISATPSDSVLPSQMVFEPEDTYLTVINAILTAAGYWSLWCDGAGVFRVEPYVDPASRPEAWLFEQGAASIHYPDWDHEQDLASIPNVYKVRRDGSDEEPGVEGIARNEDPNSPYSIGRRGFEITRSETAEVTTAAAAVALANRRLLDAMSPVSRLNVKHALLPLNPNDLVRFIDSGRDVRATVQNMRIDLTDDTDCTAEWREVGA